MEFSERVDYLIRDIANGSEQSLAELYTMLSGRLYHIALGIVCDRNAANDVVQDSFIAVWRGAKNYRYNKNAYGFVCKIVRNTALNYIKKVKRRATVDIESVCEFGECDEAFDNLDAKSEIEVAMARLDDVDKRLIMLKYYSEFTVREIGQLIGMSKSSVQRRIDTAEIRLKQLLKEARL